MKQTTFLVGALLALAIPGSAAAEWFANLEAGTRHDNNLGNAQAASDIVSDSVLTASFSAGHTMQLDDGDSLTVQGHLKQEAYDRFHGVSNLSAGGEVDVKRKFGLGAYAPWVSTSLSSEYLRYGDRVRNGRLDHLGVRGGKRVGERWGVSAEYGFENRSADCTTVDEPGFAGDAFKQRSRSLQFRADYAHNDSTFMFIGYELRRGDVVTTTLSDSDSAYDVAKAISRDPALGPNAYAYRIGGTTYSLHAGIGMAINPRIFISLSYLRQVTHADGSNNYIKSLPALTGSYSF